MLANQGWKSTSVTRNILYQSSLLIISDQPLCQRNNTNAVDDRSEMTSNNYGLVNWGCVSCQNIFEMLILNLILGRICLLR
jgi:hypothetical protein